MGLRALYAAECSLSVAAESSIQGYRLSTRLKALYRAEGSLQG